MEIDSREMLVQGANAPVKLVGRCNLLRDIGVRRTRSHLGRPVLEVFDGQ